MLDLLETAIEVAENYAHDENAAELLEGACEMGVVTIEEEDMDLEGINVFLPSHNTGEPPAFIQIGIDDSGNVIIDEGMPRQFAKDMLEDQIDQAKARIQFCEKVLEGLGIGDKPKKSIKSKYISPI